MYQCPKCKSKDLNVLCTITADLIQTEENFETEWEGGDMDFDSESPMSCKSCGFDGFAEEFWVGTK